MTDAKFAKFYQLVKDLRKTQSNYFRTRSHFVLAEAKKLEKKVDDFILLYENERSGIQSHIPLDGC